MQKLGKKLELKNQGKSTRLFRYDLNQIQGVRSDRVTEELWTEAPNIVQEVVIKTIPPKNKLKKAK